MDTILRVCKGAIMLGFNHASRAAMSGFTAAPTVAGKARMMAPLRAVGSCVSARVTSERVCFSRQQVREVVAHLSPRQLCCGSMAGVRARRGNVITEHTPRSKERAILGRTAGNVFLGKEPMEGYRAVAPLACRMARCHPANAILCSHAGAYRRCLILTLFVQAAFVASAAEMRALNDAPGCEEAGAIRGSIG